MNTVWKDRPIDPLQEYNNETHRLVIESIQLAFQELLRQKDYNKITIVEIVRRAGVSRSAFYRNFQSKEEVLQSIVYDAFTELRTEIERIRTPDSRTAWKRVIEKIAVRCQRMQEMMSPEIWQGETLLNVMNDYLREMPIDRYGKNPIFLRFTLGGIYNSIRYWIESGSEEPVETLAENIMACM